jgi:hypothetical protein
MPLTAAQQTTLRNAILADNELNALPQTQDGAFEIARRLNLNASPDFTVWKTAVSNEDIGNAMNGTEIAGLSSLNMQRLQVLSAYSNGTQNPSRADRRAAFDAAFSGAGGTITRAALLILWKRLATRLEKIFATGTGSNASPATLVVEGAISGQEVNDAMGW